MIAVTAGTPVTGRDASLVSTSGRFEGTVTADGTARRSKACSSPPSRSVAGRVHDVHGRERRWFLDDVARARTSSSTARTTGPTKRPRPVTTSGEYYDDKATAATGANQLVLTGGATIPVDES